MVVLRAPLCKYLLGLDLELDGTNSISCVLPCNITAKNNTKYESSIICFTIFVWFHKCSCLRVRVSEEGCNRECPIRKCGTKLVSRLSCKMASMRSCVHGVLAPNFFLFVLLFLSFLLSFFFYFSYVSSAFVRSRYVFSRFFLSPSFPCFFVLRFLSFFSFLFFCYFLCSCFF